jgi:hypothetical protein
MSVWAQSWAYEQCLGKWRESKKGERSWKGDPGAKSVLAAVATFADENGYAYCGQDTLAEMTDMTQRSVREHLHNLEHAYGKIRREHRRKGSGRGRGEFTSDGIWLLAPAHRLRPSRRGDEISGEEPPENVAVGEKRAHRRKRLPPGGRKGFPGNRQGVELSGGPSGVPASPGHRPDTYAGMVEEQARLVGVPLDPEEYRNLRTYAGHLIEEQGGVARCPCCGGQRATPPGAPRTRRSGRPKRGLTWRANRMTAEPHAVALPARTPW